MSDDYGRYDYHQFYAPDEREKEEMQLSAAKSEAFNDMLNLILNHKKEITKIAQCSTIDGAKGWASKRKGYFAEEKDIGGDDKPEVVVFDKHKRPIVVNGYKLKASDYPIRRMYWKENNTPEKRAGNPMKLWAQNKAYHAPVDPTNPWARQFVNETEFGTKLRDWGYKMPTKPKKKMSPYAIFSKLIAPTIKEVFESDPFLEELGTSTAALGVKGAPGKNTARFLSRLISPINMYRALYIIMVEQKYFFEMFKDKNITATKTYAGFLKFMKDYKKSFEGWFHRNILDESKTGFNDKWINGAVLISNLIYENIQWNGDDIRDLLVFLVGYDNIQKMTQKSHVCYTKDDKGYTTTCTIGDILGNDAAAAGFMQILNDKDEGKNKANKKVMTMFINNAKDTMKIYFKEKLPVLFENDAAYQDYVKYSAQGSPNARQDKDVAHQRQLGISTSPMKKSETQIRPPEVEERQMEVVGSDDDAEEEQEEA